MFMPVLDKVVRERVLMISCQRWLIGSDRLRCERDRGFHYKEALSKSGWKGAAEVVEAVREDHVFHLMMVVGGSVGVRWWRWWCGALMVGKLKMELF